MPFGDLKNDRRVMLGRAYGSLAGVAYGFLDSHTCVVWHDDCINQGSYRSITWSATLSKTPS